MERLLADMPGIWVVDYELNKQHTTIGRQNTCDLVLQLPRVSSIHAVIHREKGVTLIEDQASTNGTFVNNEKITRHILEDDDVIKIGNISLTYKTTETKTRVDKDYLLKNVEIATREAPMQKRRKTVVSVKQNIGEMPDPEENLHAILEMLVKTMQADNGYVMLVDPDTLVYTVKAWEGINPTLIGKDDLGISHSVANTAVTEGKSIISSDTRSDLRFRKQESVIHLGIRSVLCVPIKSAKRVVGVIYLDVRLQDQTFTEDDKLILEEYADTLAEILGAAPAEPSKPPQKPKQEPEAAPAESLAHEALPTPSAPTEGGDWPRLAGEMMRSSGRLDGTRVLLGHVLKATNGIAAGLVLHSESGNQIYLLSDHLCAPNFYQEILPLLALDLENRYGLKVDPWHCMVHGSSATAEAITYPAPKLTIRAGASVQRRGKIVGALYSMGKAGETGSERLAKIVSGLADVLSSALSIPH